MSKTSDLVQLVDRLIQRTRESKLQWSRAVTPNEYEVRTKDYRFVIAKDLFSPGYRLQVFSGDGRTIENFRSDESPFSGSPVNALMLRPKLEELWTTVNDESGELKKIIQSL